MSPPLEPRADDLSSSKVTNIKSVCIVGAGPSGLAAAKYLLAEKAFTEINIFEQRTQVGGLWNHSPAFEHAPDRHQVPQTNPHAGYDIPVWKNPPGSNGTCQTPCAPEFTSPVYDRLETNIPRELMGFSDLDWGADCQLFPQHEVVLEYLNTYSKDVTRFIEFETQVLGVRLVEDGTWEVKTQQLTQAPASSHQLRTFDAVVVASGHFSVPYVPHVPGIEEWNRGYPGSIIHSKFYRHPKTFADKTVIVVGNSASGIDIASQVSTTCKRPLIQSQKSVSFLQPERSPTKLEKPEITGYIPEGRKVRFADGSVEAGVDSILYCTGYFYSFPFLNSLDPPVVTHGEYVENLYQHVFYRPQQTLAFVALNQKIIPFPVAEAQSAVIARVWSGRLELPCGAEMERWEQEMLRDTGGGRNFHVLKFPMDADYINMLHDWAMAADRDQSVHHELRRRRLSSSASNDAIRLEKETQTRGKEPPYWGEKEYWTRERFPAIKKAFQSYGEDRRFKRTLEEVGFDFGEWKREKIEEARTLL